jgi:hypothetical protein
MFGNNMWNSKSSALKMLRRKEADEENEWPITPIKTNLIVGGSVVLKETLFRTTNDCNAMLHYRSTLLQVN